MSIDKHEALGDIANRKDIELLVDSFYKKAIKNEIIGYFFTKVALIQWETHIPLICDFWESILFGKVLYKGNPMLKHLTLHGKEALHSAHFKE